MTTEQPKDVFLMIREGRSREAVASLCELWQRASLVAGELLSESLRRDEEASESEAFYRSMESEATINAMDGKNEAVRKALVETFLASSDEAIKHKLRAIELRMQAKQCRIDADIALRSCKMFESTMHAVSLMVGPEGAN